MRQLEGAFYDASKIQLSRRRIDRTGYFSEVTVETPAGAGHPRPGRRAVHGQGAAHRRAAASASASPASRSSRISASIRRRTSSAPASSSAGQHQHRPGQHGLLAVVHQPVLHRRRREPGLRRLQARDRRLEPRGGPVLDRRARRRRQVRLPGIGDRARSTSASNLRVGRARRPSPTARCTTSTSSTSSATSTATPRLTAGLARDTRDSVLVPTRAAPAARRRSSSPAATCSYYRLELPAPVVLPARRATYTLLAARRARLRRRPRRQAAAVLQELLRRRPGHRCAATGRSRSARATSCGNSIGGNTKVVGSARVPVPDAGRRRASSRCAWRPSSTAGRSTPQDAKVDLGELRYAAGIGAAAGSRRSGRCASPSPMPLNAKDGDRGTAATIHLRHRVLKHETDAEARILSSLRRSALAALPRCGAQARGAAGRRQDRLRQHRAHPARGRARRSARRRRSRPSSRSATQELAKIAGELKTHAGRAREERRDHERDAAPQQGARVRRASTATSSASSASSART